MVRKLVLEALLYIAGLVIPLGAVALFYTLWYVGSQSIIATVALIGVAIVFAVVAMLLININLTGPHRLYRDQLGRTFVYAKENDDTPIPLKLSVTGVPASIHTRSILR